MVRKLSLLLIVALMLQVIPYILSPQEAYAATSFTTIEENDSSVVYGGQWSTSSGSYSGGSSAFSKDRSASITVPFTGTGFVYMGSTGASLQQLEIFIDGKSVKKINVGSGALKSQVEVYTASGLRLGTHEFKLMLSSPANKLSTINVISFDALKSFTETPKPPTKAYVSWTVTGVHVKWDKVKWAESYRVYRSTNPESGYQLITSTTGEGNIEVSDTTPLSDESIRYYYTVTAISNGGQESTSTSPVNVVVPMIAKKPPSSVKVVVDSSNVVVLSWKAANSVTGYKVYRSKSKTDNYELVSTVNEGLQYTDHNFEGLYFSKNEPYYYKVSTLYPTGSESVPSSVVSATIKAYKGPKPTLQLQDGKVLLQWAAVSSQPYRVYRAKSSSGPFNLLGEVATGTTTYTDSKDFALLGANTRYYYAITTLDRLNTESLRSDAVSIIVPKPPIGRPAALNVQFQENRSVILTWSPVTGSSGYYVYRMLAPLPGETDIIPLRISGSVKVLGTTYTDTSFIGQTVNQDTNYVYFVSAVTQAGMEGYKSEGATALISKSAPDNLLVNSDFKINSQNGTVAEGWTRSLSLGAQGEFQVIPGATVADTSVVKITGTNLPFGGVSMLSQTVPVREGQGYRFSGNLAIDQLNHAKVQLYIDYLDSNNQWLGLAVREFTESNNSAAPFSFESTAPAGAVNATIYAILRGVDNRGYGALKVDSLFFGKQADITAPNVLSSNPQDGAVEVLNQNIDINFDENIALVDGAPDITLIEAGNVDASPLALTLAVSANKLTITPVDELNKNKTFTLVIPGGRIKDSTGNIAGQGQSITFTTEASTVRENLILNSGFEERVYDAYSIPKWIPSFTFGVVGSPSIVIDHIASGERSLKLSGSELPSGGFVMASQSFEIGNGQAFLMDAQVFVDELDGAVFQWYVDFLDEGGNWIGSQSKALPSPTSGYLKLEVSGKTPEGTVKAKVYAILRGTQANGSGLVYVDDTRFLIAPQDLDPPTIVGIEPLEQSGGAFVNAVIALTFQEPIEEDALFGDIRLSTGQRVIPIAVRIDNNRLFIASKDLLEPGKTYALSVPAGAVKDKSGNPLQTAYEHTFNTSSELNDLLNGDFEQGSTAWFPYVTPGGLDASGLVVSGSSTGQKAQLLSASQLPDGGVSMIYQDVSVVPGVLYRWGGRFKITDLNGSQFQLYIDYLDASGLYLESKVKSLSQTTSDFVLLEDTGVAPELATTARIHLILRSYSASGSGTLTADSIRFESIGQGEGEAPSDLLLNGSFEDGTETEIPNWYGYAPNGLVDRISKVTSPVSSGASALRIFAENMEAGDFYTVFQDITVQPGIKITLSGKLSLERADNAIGQVFIDYLDADGNWLYSRSVDQTVITAGYQTFEIVSASSAQATRVRVYIILRAIGSEGAGTLYVDDIQVRAVLGGATNT
jgi:fibronectin type 3 domain-containing protein